MKLNKNNYRYDFPIIANWVKSNSKVLDLGCGDGELLNYLKKERNITGYGIEKDPDKWLKSLKTDINVLQVDIEAGLPEFEDNSFDVVILSKTIQSMHNTEEILDEIGFLKKIQADRLMMRLRLLFNRTQMEKEEVNILRGILSEIQKKLK